MRGGAFDRLCGSRVLYRLSCGRYSCWCSKRRQKQQQAFRLRKLSPSDGEYGQEFPPPNLCYFPEEFEKRTEYSDYLAESLEYPEQSQDQIQLRDIRVSRNGRLRLSRNHKQFNLSFKEQNEARARLKLNSEAKWRRGIFETAGLPKFKRIYSQEQAHN